MKRSRLDDDDFLRVEANDCPMSSCAAPAGSPCRTGNGKVAIQYHTARFRLVPYLAKALSVLVPALRRPGSAWAQLPRPALAGTGQAGHVRIGTPAPPPSASPWTPRWTRLRPRASPGSSPRRSPSGP